MIVITKDHLPASSPKRPGNKIDLRYLCIHSPANAKSTAKNERAWLENPSNTRSASWNYCIDEKDCIEAIPSGEEAWAQQSGNKSCASLEICESGDRAKTVDRAAQFCAEFLKARSWGTERLRRHNDFYSQKNCPGIFYEKGSWAKWISFKTLVQAKMKGATSAVVEEKTKPQVFVPLNAKGITTYVLNIRPTPSTDRAAVGTLEKNQSVNILGKIGDFYKIKEGYIAKDYIKITQELPLEVKKEEIPTKKEPIKEVVKKEESNWKFAGIEYLVANNIKVDESWKSKIDEPMPAWAVFSFLSRILEEGKKGE